MISATSEGFSVGTYAFSLPPSRCEDKAQFDSESPTLRCSKFRQHINIPGVGGPAGGRMRTQMWQRQIPNDKHVRTRLSALIIDIAFDVDSSHVADIIFDHAVP
jgi:hypothetical protein